MQVFTQKINVLTMTKLHKESVSHQMTKVLQSWLIYIDILQTFLGITL